MRSPGIVLALVFLVSFAACTTPRAEEKRAKPLPERQVEPRPVAPLLDGLPLAHHWISTKVPAAQRLFDQGLTLYFGGIHAEAVRSFREAARLDPTCAVCLSFAALALGPSLDAEMSPAHLSAARAYALEAMSRAEGGTVRERAYVAAIAARYLPGTRDRRSRDAAWAEAAAQLAEWYPDDLDAAALEAEAIMLRHPEDYFDLLGEPHPWTRRILALVEGVLKRQPRHLLANRLHIETLATSPEPLHALPSAQRLEGLDTILGHLLHLPSRIYLRLGDYHAASEANRRAVAADERYLGQVTTGGIYPLLYLPHHLHALAVSTTLEGRGAEAVAAADAAAEKVDPVLMREPEYGALQHYLVLPFYVRVAFGRWAEILALPPVDSELPYPRAIEHFARGMAHAARGEVIPAELELLQVRDAAKDDRLAEVRLWGATPTAPLVALAALVLEAEVASARKKTALALTLYRRAVALEDKLPPIESLPPWLPSARRALAAELLSAGFASEAQEGFRADLARFPGNGWALYGLIASLRALGRSAEAALLEDDFSHAFRNADVVLTASLL
jgi:tetratricopeptide (TPR) repeat protein